MPQRSRRCAGMMTRDADLLVVHAFDVPGFGRSKRDPVQFRDPQHVVDYKSACFEAWIDASRFTASSVVFNARLLFYRAALPSRSAVIAFVGRCMPCVTGTVLIFQVNNNMGVCDKCHGNAMHVCEGCGAKHCSGSSCKGGYPKYNGTRCAKCGASKVK